MKEREEIILEESLISIGVSDKSVHWVEFIAEFEAKVVDEFTSTDE